MSDAEFIAHFRKAMKGLADDHRVAMETKDVLRLCDLADKNAKTSEPSKPTK